MIPDCIQCLLYAEFNGIIICLSRYDRPQSRMWRNFAGCRWYGVVQDVCEICFLIENDGEWWKRLLKSILGKYFWSWDDIIVFSFDIVESCFIKTHNIFYTFDLRKYCTNFLIPFTFQNWFRINLSSPLK